MTGDLSVVTILGLFGFGAAGALFKDILHDGTLELPHIGKGQIFLGFLSSLLVGGFIGYLVDHSWLTAFLAGYTGFSAVSKILSAGTSSIAVVAVPDTTPAVAGATANVLPADISTKTIPEIIQTVSSSLGVDPVLALKVATCESGLNPKARNVNKGGSTDRGLYQINNYYHKDVTNEQADDPVFATTFFCKAVLAGNINWWNASKACWGSALKS